MPIETGLPKIDPPSDMSPDGMGPAGTYNTDQVTLGGEGAAPAAYTPYEAVTDTVDTDSTVQGRLSGLLSQNSDYIQRARTGADRTSNRRGMLNSSMAAGAAEGAAIDAALPIATSDAKSFLDMQFKNQEYNNEAGVLGANLSVDREAKQADLDAAKGEFDATQDFDAAAINVEDASNIATDAAAAEVAADAATAKDERMVTAAETLADVNATAAELADARDVLAAGQLAENQTRLTELDATIATRLAKLDATIATDLENLKNDFSLAQNLDSVNGSIYQQLIKGIGDIISSEPNRDVAISMVNDLILAAGVEFEFSDGARIGGATSDDETSGDETGGDETGGDETGGPSLIPETEEPATTGPAVGTSRNSRTTGGSETWNGTSWVRDRGSWQ